MISIGTLSYDMQAESMAEIAKILIWRSEYMVLKAKIGFVLEIVHFDMISGY